VLVFYLALPDDKNVEASLTQRDLFSRVPCAITSDLFAPEFDVRFWCARQSTTEMSVPKTPVHEYRPTTVAIRNVGPTRQILWANAKSEPTAMQKLSNGDLDIGILLPNSTHPRGHERINAPGAFVAA
jgi:hypothetical protein